MGLVRDTDGATMRIYIILAQNCLLSFEGTKAWQYSRLNFSVEWNIKFVRIMLFSSGLPKKIGLSQKCR